MSEEGLKVESKDEKQTEAPIDNSTSGANEESSSGLQVSGASEKDSEERKANVKAIAKRVEEEVELKYGAIHVIQLFVPISICLVLVVLTITGIPFFAAESKQQLLYAPFSEAEVSSSQDKMLRGLYNALIMMCMVIVTTFVLILLYKYRCYLVIHGWLILSSTMVLFVFSLLYFSELVKALQISLDYITAFMFCWNIGVVGMIAIHCKAPLKLQQGYLIFVSAILALIFIKFLPPWTTWIVLFLMVLWDLFAVLCPQGPLNMLVKIAKERNEPIFPAMIYSSMAHIQFLQMNATQTTTPNAATTTETGVETTTGASTTAGTSTTGADIATGAVETAGKTTTVTKKDGSVAKKRPKSMQKKSSEVFERSTSSSGTETHGIKLGLGDFIFYSVLVGKASILNDWNTTLACFISILVGLSLTLLLLAIFRKALPALPISLTFGLIFLSCTSIFVQPFADTLSEQQVFI